MNYPKPVKKGDTIGIVAPSSPIDKKYIKKCVKKLENLGFKVKVGKSPYEEFGGYLAGNDELRANDINEMFADPEVNGIICTRGGYGTARMMKKLDLDIIKNNPKAFVGYSDITNIHSYLNNKAGMISFHGPMVYSNLIKDDEYTENGLLEQLALKENIKFENPVGEEIEVLVEGKVTGELAGGCLSILVSGIGTDYEVNTKGKILFFEEIEEPTYSIDRMLQQMIDAGKMDDVIGFVIGDFNDCNPRDKSEFTIMEIINQKIKPLNKPTLYNVKSGHCQPMGTLTLGAVCELDTKDKSLIINKK